MKPYPILLLALLGILFSCNDHAQRTYSNPEDYNAYLGSAAAAQTSKYYELWNSKIKPDSLQLLSFGHVAAEYSRYFEATGKISYLKKAEQALQKAVEIAAIGKADYNRSLARNYIAQHRFTEALALAQQARAYGSGVKESQYLLFDVTMELGQYGKAEKYLDSVKNFSDFGYLIRLAKWNDHKGKLETTIEFMEKAAIKAENAKNLNLMAWTYTNLADYYGHAGRIGDSYRYYLRALALDPANAYAKKGIAWIVFSYEKNPEEALRILDSVTRHYQAPDYYLLKSEIADYIGDDKERLFNLDQYFKMVKNPGYGEMYNAYNVAFYLEQANQFDRALELAKKEVVNRPTPESYGLLAYSLYKTGKVQQAEDIVEDFIVGRTYEPATLLTVAEIFKANGKPEKARALKAELIGSLYELGPSVEERIRAL